MIHMLETLVFVPLIFIVAFVYHKGKTRFTAFVLFLVSTLIIGGLVEFMMSGYYTWLAFEKLYVFLSSVSLERLVAYMFLLVVGSFMLILGRRLLRARSERFYISEARFSRIKLVATGGLLILYISGLFYFVIAPIDLSSQQTNYLTSSFPWYLYVTRYGFVGIFALFGVAIVSWKENWFKIAATWSIAIIALGSIWWGTRMNAYLFPMLALLAAVGTNTLWQKAHNTIQITITTAKNQTGKQLKINLKPIMATILITIMALSFTSLIYGAAYYITSGPSLNEDTVKTLQWINNNTPQNATILVPNIYNIHKSVNTIADRKVYLETNLPTAIDPVSFINLTQTIQTYNILYALTIENTNSQNYLKKLLLTYSNLTFQSGQNRIYKLPKLTPPTPESSIAVLYNEQLGLTNTTTFAWHDDNFTTNWTYKTVNATTDGETLTYQWNFHTNNTQEPSMKTIITPTKTNTHPYLIISYRNTPQTTTTAEDNVGQIITLINRTGYAKGFFKNIFLPISKQNAFNIFTAKLPENQEVAEVWIWMRNYKKLKGTVNLQIDFIGLSSVENIPGNPTDIQFLTMTIPALWTTNYSITQNPETQNASTVISTYDKSTPTFILESNNTKIFVFLNQTATPPSWGTNWQGMHPNIITGYMNEKKIIICGTRDINQENITIIAEIIQRETEYQTP